MRCIEPFQVRLQDHLVRKIKVIEGNLSRDNLTIDKKHYLKPTRERLEEQLKFLKGLL